LCIHKLIDCYDKSISSSQDFFNELNDSYLVIYNSDLDDETIRKMKSNRIFAVDSADTGGNAKIEWLTRDGKNSESENFNNRIVDDILTFSFVKDLQQASKSHISAESTKMGLMGVEQLCVEKETYFRTALMKRLEIICNVYNLFGNDFNVDDVKITFVRNIPQNLGVIANNVNLLKDTVSTKTLLSQIPFVQSVDDELKQLEEERKNNYDNEIKTETIVQ
jgi:SPP1 family phage portal protein